MEWSIFSPTHQKIHFSRLLSRYLNHHQAYRAIHLSTKQEKYQPILLLECCFHGDGGITMASVLYVSLVNVASYKLQNALRIVGAFYGLVETGT